MTAVHFRARLRAGARVESFESRVQNVARELGGLARPFERTLPVERGRRVRGVLVDLAPGVETLALLVAPEGVLVPLLDVDAAERGPIDEPPRITVRTRLASIDSHVVLVELLAALGERFLELIELRDDGGYWPARDARRLALLRGEAPTAVPRARAGRIRVERALAGVAFEEASWEWDDALLREDEDADDALALLDAAPLEDERDPLVARAHALVLAVVDLARDGFLDAAARGAFELLGGVVQAGPSPASESEQGHLERALRGAALVRGDLGYGAEDGIVDRPTMERLVASVRELERAILERRNDYAGRCATMSVRLNA